LTDILAKSSEGIHGLYVEALCGGLDEVLRDYRCVLAQIEKVILQTGDARLSHLQHKIVIINLVSFLSLLSN
jgi:hypothetical protein